MPALATLIASVRGKLLDNSGQRFSDEDRIEQALQEEARALFANPAVPSDMLLSVCTKATATPVKVSGLFIPPTDFLRICAGYVASFRVERVISSAGPGRPMNEQTIATPDSPAIFIEGGETFLLPPGAFTEQELTVLYVPREFDVETVPPAFEDALTLGAASRLAFDAQEMKTGEILLQRAASHLSRVIGASK